MKDSLFGTHAGPEVNHIVFRQMIDELPGITVLTEHRLKSVQHKGRRIQAVTLTTPDGEVTLRGDYFVDATYEGDLMAGAGVPYRVGREDARVRRVARAGSGGQATTRIQLSTYDDGSTSRIRRLFRNRMATDRKTTSVCCRCLRTDRSNASFGDPFMNLGGGIYKRQTPKLPNGKWDINDVSRGIVRLSLPGI